MKINRVWIFVIIILSCSPRPEDKPHFQIELPPLLKETGGEYAYQKVDAGSGFRADRFGEDQSGFIADPYKKGYGPDRQLGQDGGTFL
jgi:hypothetical protein